MGGFGENVGIQALPQAESELAGAQEREEMGARTRADDFAPQDISLTSEEVLG